MHLRYAVEIFGEQMGVRQFRNHLSWYARGVRGSAAFRSAISSISEMSEMEEMIRRLFPRTGKRAGHSRGSRQSLGKSLNCLDI